MEMHLFKGIDHAAGGYRTALRKIQLYGVAEIFYRANLVLKMNHKMLIFKLFMGVFGKNINRRLMPPRIKNQLTVSFDRFLLATCQPRY